MIEAGGPLLLVGCGKMGGALLAGWIANGLAPADAYVVEPDAGLRTGSRERHGVEPSSIRVEITEQALAGTNVSTTMLSELARTGIDLVLDDFNGLRAFL